MTRPLALAGLGVVLVAAILSVRAFRDPLTNDGAYYPLMARVVTGQITHPHFKPHEAGVIPHPPMYQISLALVTLIFGGDLIYYKLFGVFCGLLNCLLIRANVRLIMEGRQERDLATLLAVATYLLNPFGRIGMLVTDIDYVVVPPPLLLLCYLTVRFGREPAPKKLLHLVAGQALALWSKLTSSLVFPFVLGIQLVIRKDRKWSFAQVCYIGVGGVALFAVSWWAFSVVADYPTLHLLRIIGVFRDKAVTQNKFLQVGRNIVGSIMWFGPAFLLLAVLAIPQMLDRGWRELETATVYGWILFLVYLYIGGLAFTLPKYQYPSTALLAIPVGVLIAKAWLTLRVRLGFAVLCTVTVALLQFVIGDPLYHLFGELRNNAFSTHGRLVFPYLLPLGIQLIGLSIPLVVCTLWSRRDQLRWIVALAIVMFGYDLGLGFRQMQADYVTTYNYGTRGVQDVLSTIRPGSKVLVHEGAILDLWNTKQLRFADLPADRITVSGRELVSMVEYENPDYFVVGLAMNTIAEMYNMRTDVVLQEYLRANYREMSIGDYVLYEKQPINR